MTTTRSFPPYAQYDTRRLLEAFIKGPARLRSVIRDLTEPELRACPRGEGTWSAHEIVLHTADSEVQGAYRIRKIIAEPGCDLPRYAPDAWAGRLRYSAQPAIARARALQLLSSLRKWASPVFKSAGPDDWSCWGNHPDYGPVSLRQLLELYADHSERHIAQIVEIRRRLGRAIVFPLLLPDRLY